jgi:hypothetical protein
MFSMDMFGNANVKSGNPWNWTGLSSNFNSSTYQLEETCCELPAI